MKWRLDAGQIEVMDEAIAAVLRLKSPAERIAMASDCNRTARDLVAGRLKTQHTDWSEAQIRSEVGRRFSRESR
ncbi:MAG: hypothetical protein EXS09_10540 [Gemmataceae bacterium]|nr:hypothetical protein [Gemmataceae bacterium]